MKHNGSLFKFRSGSDVDIKDLFQNVSLPPIRAIKEVGISNYHVYLCGLQLFIYFEADDVKKALDLLQKNADYQKWQLNLAPMLEDSRENFKNINLSLQETFFTVGYSGPMNKVQRFATYMRIKPDASQKYIYEHTHIWPSILEGINRVRIRNYTIFISGVELFSYFEVEDLNKAMHVLAEDTENQRWQQHMAPLMEVNSGIEDGSSICLEEIFHID